jgi:hypothetical protein
VFYNECLGESCDVGSKLLTTTDIKNASVSTIKNELEKVTDTSFLSQFTQITMGVDWGGQTAPVGRNKLAHMAEDMAEAMSYTTIAIVGQWSTGKQQCIYAYRFPLGVNHMDETTTILNLYRRFRCRFLAHDFGGSGAARETILVQAGLDSNVIIPLLYIGNSTKNFIVFQPADESRPRNYWSLDKSRSLVTLCLALKQQQVFLPEYESAKDVTSDLLALMEDKVERPGSADILRVVRQPKSRDDFAHSLNYACVSNWHSTDSWPRFAAAYSYGAQTSEDNPTNAEY